MELWQIFSSHNNICWTPSMAHPVPPLPVLKPKPKPKEYDSLNREILERKCHGDYKDGRLVFYGYIKKINHFLSGNPAFFDLNSLSQITCT